MTATLPTAISRRSLCSQTGRLLLAGVAAGVPELVQGEAGGGKSRSTDDRSRHAIDLFDYLTDAEIAAVRSGTVSPGLAKSVQVAIDAAAAQNGVLTVQPGTYLFDPIIPIRAEGSHGDTVSALLIRSNMHIRGTNAVFKIKDGVSTDAAPRSMALFATDIALSNVSVEDLVLDMNGQNNQISPHRGSLSYNRFNQSQWLVSGTNGGIRNAARIDGCRLERVTFRYNPGVSACCFAQSNITGAALGSGWVLRDCLFLDNGLDTDDHSCIFAWANDVLIDGCRFLQTTPTGTVGLTGGNTAVEVHGADTRIVNCLFVNFSRGIWVASNYTQEVRRTIIRGNSFRTLFYGVDFFRDSAVATEIADTIIADNAFSFDDTGVAAQPSPNFKACINITSPRRQRDIDIHGNTANKTSPNIPAAFLVISNGAAGGEVHTAIRANGNSARGLTFGTFIRTAVSSNLGTIDIRGNNWLDLTPSTSPAFPAVGDNIEHTSTPAKIEHLMIGGGSCIDDRASPVMSYGMMLNSPVGRLDRETHAIRGAAVADYIEKSAFSISLRDRHGMHSNIGFVPAWHCGGTGVVLGNGSVAATMSISDQTITVQAQLTAGSTTVIPAGDLAFDLPIAAQSGGLPQLGTARILNASTDRFRCIAAEIGAGGTSARLKADSATKAANFRPIALAAGDVLSVQIVYQRA